MLTFMPVTATRKKLVRNITIGETSQNSEKDENNKNGKNKQKDGNLETNFV